MKISAQINSETVYYIVLSALVVLPFSNLFLSRWLVERNLPNYLILVPVTLAASVGFFSIEVD